MAAPYTGDPRTFADRIAAMNHMYKLPINGKPTLGDGATVTSVCERLDKFHRTLIAEVNEIPEIGVFGQPPEDILTQIADVLADITVYCRSEALKYGIPLEEVLKIVMDSNESKLGADGEPIYDENGKFLKGPNYWRPEPKIRELLITHAATMAVARTPTGSSSVRAADIP